MDKENIEFLGYGLFLVRLEELQNSLKQEVLPFSDVYEKLCRNFSISKQLCKRILNKLYLYGYIEHVNSHGIKLTPYTKEMLVYIDLMDRSINN